MRGNEEQERAYREYMRSIGQPVEEVTVVESKDESVVAFVVKCAITVAGIIVLIVVLLFGIGFANRSYTRYQRVQDARNQQKVVQMQINSTAQQVEVEKQKALIRIEEANGIAESQRIIDASLTTDYLTYLAIQAQMELANSDNDTVIYIPVGENGIPLVRDTATDEGQAPSE